MKFAIRKGVFETNSSSTHSVTIVGKNPGYDHTLTIQDLPDITELKVNEEYDKVISEFGEFGWGPDCFNSIKLKLSYALTMVAETEAKHINSSNEYFETVGFKMINDAIADRYHCKGVLVSSDIEIKKYGNESYIDIEGYIDHQSYEYYNSLKDFLDEYGIDIDTFLFDKNVVVFILNDNSDFDEYDKYLKNHINIMDGYYEDEYDDDVDAEENY